MPLTDQQITNSASLESVDGDGLQSTTKRRFWERAKDPKEMVFSHHPPCNKYKSHTFRIGQYNFCIGCYVGYPAAVAGIIFGSWLYLGNATSLYLLLGIGFTCYLTFLFSFSRYSEKKPVKMSQKLAIGLGSGFLLVFGFYIFDIWVGFKILIGIGIFFGLLQPIRLFHNAKLIAVCDACTMKETDPNCTEEKITLE